MPDLPAQQRRERGRSRALAPGPRRGLTVLAPRCFAPGRSGASASARSHRVPQVSRSPCVLPQAKHALGLKQTPLRPLLARHTFASIGIAAGLNAKTLSTCTQNFWRRLQLVSTHRERIALRVACLCDRRHGPFRRRGWGREPRSRRSESCARVGPSGSDRGKECGSGPVARSATLACAQDDRDGESNS